MVYKGLKPVHWCTSCRTALAEAEVEHADHITCLPDLDRIRHFPDFLSNKSVISIETEPSCIFALFRLGEILAFDLGNLNDSIDYFENIVNNFEESTVFPSATFALYSIYNIKNDSKKNVYRERILNTYPDSDFAKFIIEWRKYLVRWVSIWLMF